MVEDLCLPVRLVDLPTIRERDGLALSSRNRYLDAAQRKQALCLSRALNRARRLAESGERRTATLCDLMRSDLSAVDELEYVEIRSVPELQEVTRIQETVLVAVAARVGTARLIDNQVWDLSSGQVKDGHLLGEF